MGDDFPGSTPRPPCHFDEWRACPLARLAEREKARPEGACQPRTRRSQEAGPRGEGRRRSRRERVSRERGQSLGVCGNGLVGGSWFRVLVRRRKGVRSTRRGLLREFRSFVVLRLKRVSFGEFRSSEFRSTKGSSECCSFVVVVREEECEGAGSSVRRVEREARSSSSECWRRSWRFQLRVRVCRGDTCHQDTRQPTEPREVSLLFLFIWVFVCVCVVRPRPAK